MKTESPTANGSVSQNDVQRVATKDLVRSPYNREIDPLTLDQQFLDSVRQHGVIQPLIVRSITASLMSGFDPAAPRKTSISVMEIVAGERRWRAAQRLKLGEVPVIVRQLTDTQAIEIQAIENLQRADLSPIEEATKYQQLADAYKAEGLTVEKAIARVAERVGKGKATIYQALRLLKLPAALQSACVAGTLPASHAAELARLEDAPEVQARLLQEILVKPKGEYDHEASRDEKGLLSFREAKERVDVQVKLSKARAAWRAAAEKARNKGLTVLGEEAITAVLGKYGVVGGGYVQGQTGATDYSGSYPAKTYAQLMGKHAPPVVLAHDADYNMLKLYKKSEANLAIEKAGHKKRTISALSNDRWEKENRRRNEKRQRMEPVIAAARKLLLEAAGKRGTKAPWHLIADEFLAYNEGWMKEMIARHHWATKGPARETIILNVAAAPENAVPGLLSEILIGDTDGWGTHNGRAGDFDPNFKRLAKHYGVNLDKLTRELVPDPKKEKKAKPVKSKLQTPGAGRGTTLEINVDRQGKLKRKPFKMGSGARERLSEMMRARWAKRKPVAK